jgi:histidinol dehydrogenase
MGAVPAMVAGVEEIVMSTPSISGKISDSVLVAADLCGIKNIYKMGGATSIAALTFGTKTIAKVDKIVGPGNNFVALAKKQVFGEVGIYMIAGPTDVLIIADNKNKPEWIASDLLSQLEHGKDSRAILITDDKNFAKAVVNSLTKIKQNLSRLDIIKQSIKNSAIIIADDLENQATKIANEIAPEHLQIIAKNQDKIFSKITNAGAIFLGEYSPEAIGDYIAGPSHTLPTMATAKFSSGLSVFDFLKRISVIDCSKNGFEKLVKNAEILAKTEGFDAHQLSLSIRR